MALHLRLLGRLEVRPASERLVTLPTRKAEALLAVLGRRPGERHARESLAALLWPDGPQASARTNLRQTLKQLRKALSPPGRELFIAEVNTLALDATLVDVDVARFEALHDRGTQAALQEAADLYRGDFLDGVAPPTEPFAEWVTFERMRLRERGVAVLSKLLSDELSDRRTERAVQTAIRLLALDPLQEQVHRQLMRLYVEQDRRSAALEQYRFCRSVLRRELDVEPEPETEALYREIREVHYKQPVVTSLQTGSGSPPAGENVLSRPAVAVLPFANLNGDPKQTYFSDGIGEDLITALAGWRRFPLIASSSTFTYRDRSRDVRRIADDLDARYVVAGSVRQADRRARINARLIEAESGRILWTQRFDVDSSDILQAQEECAETIAAAVEPELERAELSRIVPKRTEDLSAWDRFLQGMSFLHRFTLESNALARTIFQRAIELDRSYSDAFTGLAQSHLYDILIGAGSERDKSLAHGFEAAREAVALDPNSSVAHSTLGHANVWAQEFDRAIMETELAIELNPSNAHARLALGNRLDLIGRTAEGISQIERGLRLNPRDPRRWVYMGFLSRAHLDAGQYEEALSWAQRAVRVRPDQPDSHFRMAACLAHLGRAAEARAALAECERLRPGLLAVKASWRPYSDPARNEHFFAGLHRFGLLG